MSTIIEIPIDIETAQKIFKDNPHILYANPDDKISDKYVKRYLDGFRRELESGKPLEDCVSPTLFLHDYTADCYSIEGKKDHEIQLLVAHAGLTRPQASLFLSENSELGCCVDYSGIINHLLDQDVCVAFELDSDSDNGYLISHCNMLRSGGYTLSPHINSDTGEIESTYEADVIAALEVDPYAVAVAMRKGGIAVKYFDLLDAGNDDLYAPLIRVPALIQEFANTCTSYNRLTIFTCVSFGELNKRVFTVPMMSTCGLFDSEVGSGSMLRLDLTRDIVIDLDKELDPDTHSRWQMKLDTEFAYSPIETYQINVYKDPA